MAAGLAQMLWQAPMQSVAELAHEFPLAPGPGRCCWRPSRCSATRSWPTDCSPIWSAGPRRPPPSTWACWCLILKLDADYLEGGGGDQPEGLRTNAASRARGRVRLPTSKDAIATSRAAAALDGGRRAAGVAAIAPGHAHVPVRDHLFSGRRRRVARSSRWSCPGRARQEPHATRDGHRIRWST